MRVYKCENCGSVFIVNEADKRISSGDYCFIGGCNCPLCSAGMVSMTANEPSEDD